MAPPVAGADSGDTASTVTAWRYENISSAAVKSFRLVDMSTGTLRGVCAGDRHSIWCDVTASV